MGNDVFDIHIHNLKSLEIFANSRVSRVTLQLRACIMIAGCSGGLPYNQAFWTGNEYVMRRIWDFYSLSIIDKATNPGICISRSKNTAYLDFGQNRTQSQVEDGELLLYLFSYENSLKKCPFSPLVRARRWNKSPIWVISSYFWFTVIVKCSETDFVRAVSSQQALNIEWLFWPSYVYMCRILQKCFPCLSSLELEPNIHRISGQILMFNFASFWSF